MLARHAAGLVSREGSPKSPAPRCFGFFAALTKPKQPKDFPLAKQAAPVPQHTRCIRRFRRYEFRDFPSCRLPDRCAATVAFRSRGTVRAPPEPAPNRDGVSRRANKRAKLLPELARRFCRERKYPPAFFCLLRGRDFQCPCVRRRLIVPILSARLPRLSNSFRIPRRTSSVRAGFLPAWRFPFQRWRFRAAVLCR